SLKYLPCKDFCFIFAIVSGIFGSTISEIILSLKFKETVKTRPIKKTLSVVKNKDVSSGCVILNS
ncbi:unnamed protein product, partial [Tenebrio molitor]